MTYVGLAWDTGGFALPESLEGGYWAKTAALSSNTVPNKIAMVRFISFSEIM
jgi:hypothetical protein